MADAKITELAEHTTPGVNDVLPVVDVSGTPTTKKIKVSTLDTRYLNTAGDSLTGSLGLSTGGGINLPHLMQSDTTDQAIANVANAQVITFDTDVHHDNITRTSSSRFTVIFPGSYLITFSGITTGVINKRMEVWLRVNGNDVANSNTIYTYKSNGGTAVVAVSFIEHFAVNDYFEFWTWGDDTGNKWDATAAGTSPTRPATPSIIITANYVAGD